ncbi:MAG: hypothetical protein B7X06_01785 [Verrucomicrobia bacterium 21-51-4]|nr:MAG: hypothetical protein B7X06_01785 [Verrucomicrobia bacterium 21-51-4]HQU09029.1 protein phosphatase 2C domain-containing protein [Opitutales bacterium]
MPGIQLKILSYGQTDIGLMRERNEDAFLCENELQLYAVADGVGGLPNGSLASAMAVEMIYKMISELPSDCPIPWTDAFNTINSEVHERGIALDENTGMGTTLTTAVIRGDIMSYAHVGDTGIMLFRNNKIIRITKDHTLGQQMIDEADTEAKLYIPEQFLHSLTRCIGQYGFLPVDTGEEQLHPGDRVMIYSDGVSCGWTDDELLKVVNGLSTAETVVKKIIQQSNARGGIDNCTAVVIFVE